MHDSYVYPGTTILVNLNSIKDQKKLDQLENTLVNLALIKILKEDKRMNSLREVYWIHKQLFQEIYGWAGKPRKLNIYKNEIVLNGKSVTYSTHTDIKNDIYNLNLLFVDKDWKSLSKPQFVIEISILISKLWRIHPFREGNTRTVTTFLYFFLKGYGIDLNQEFLKNHAKFFRNALVMSSIDDYSEYGHLQNILDDAIIYTGVNKAKSAKLDKSKYSTIKGIDMDNYAYNYHSTKE